MLPRNINKSNSKPEKTSRVNTTENANAAENIRAAHEQADEDIGKDPDLSFHSPNDDLDESEAARLGEDKTDLV